MKKYNKRNFFHNKTCDICKRPATLFRVFNNKIFVLCDSKKCDKLSRSRMGFIKLIEIGLKNGR